MPRLYPEELYESSSDDGYLEISEATYSAVTVKDTNATLQEAMSQNITDFVLQKDSIPKGSRETSIQTDPTSFTASSIEVRITASQLFFTSCHSQDGKYNATRSAHVSETYTGNGKKRAREEDDMPVLGHDIKRARHLDACQWCQLAAFEGFNKYPVVITNEVDNIPLPGSFRFIQNSILRAGVERAEDAFRSGCECDDKMDCEKSGCTCTEDVEKVPGTKVAAHRMQYQTPPGERNCLKDAFLDQRQAIYECNEKCACGPACKNRVVERGRTVPLEIFKTSDHRGWGMSTGFYFQLLGPRLINNRTAMSRRPQEGAVY